MTAKRVFVGVAVVFVAVLAVIIGQRMSTDAMAVVIGVIFGVGASIPTSLLIVAVTRRAQERELEERGAYRERTQPPVIVVSPGGGQVSPWYAPFAQPMLPTTMEGQPTRRFRVVGEQDGVLDAELWRGGL